MYFESVEVTVQKRLQTTGIKERSYIFSNCIMNVMVQSRAFLICSREVPSFNLDLNIRYLENVGDSCHYFSKILG